MGIRSQSSRQADVWGLHACPGEAASSGLPLGCSVRSWVPPWGRRGGRQQGSPCSCSQKAPRSLLPVSNSGVLLPSV